MLTLTRGSGAFPGLHGVRQLESRCHVQRESGSNQFPGWQRRNRNQLYFRRKYTMTRMRCLSVSLLATLLLLVLAAPVARAQSMFGNLTGNVVDPAGAVVVGADVTAKLTLSGEVRKTVTNRDGFFALTGLPAAAYDITVTAKTFERYHATNITLSGGESRTMTITLKVGAATDTVEVSASVTDLAPIASGEKSYTISSADLEQLALVGRDATEIMNIMPGAILSSNGGVNRLSNDSQTITIAATAGEGPLSNANINGQLVDVTMDGGHTLDPGQPGNAVPVTANQDMISEIKIMTSNFTADNPKGPVVVNTVTKIGGHDFHGDFHLYARNNALNSYEKEEEVQNNIAVAAGGINEPKATTHMYYPGGSFSGPIIIPHTGFNKSRQKLFFFDGFEKAFQLSDAGITRAYVLTPAMQGGDYSQVNSYNGTGGSTVINVEGGNILEGTPAMPIKSEDVSWTGAPWYAFTEGAGMARANNCTISATGVMASVCMDPNGHALLASGLAQAQPTTLNAVPIYDNSPVAFNYIKDITEPANLSQNMAKVEWDVSDNTKLTVGWSRERQAEYWVMGLWDSPADDAVPMATPSIEANQSDFVSATLMHVFSPSTTSETKFFYTFINIPGTLENPTLVQRASLPGWTLQGIYDPPTSPAIAPWGAGYPDLGEIGNTYHPNLITWKKIPAFGEDLTRVFGRHETKFGFYAEHIDNTQDNWEQYNGTYTWAWYGQAAWAGVNSGSFTGNMYADTAMGFGAQGYTEQAQPPPSVQGINDIAGYAQDNWKVSRHVTAQYGIRLDHYGKPYQPIYGTAVFNPGEYINDPAFIADNTGIDWHFRNPAIPLSGTTSRFVFFEPRLGIAYDVFGNGKTIARGGIGWYRAYDGLGNPLAQLTAVGSIVRNVCEGLNNASCGGMDDVEQYRSAKPNFFGATSLVAGTVTNTDVAPISPTVVQAGDTEQPLVTTYSATIDQKLPWKLNLETSYVGNIARDYDGTQQNGSGYAAAINLNTFPVGALLIPERTGVPCNPVTQPAGNPETPAYCEQMLRPLVNYGALPEVMLAGLGRFDSLQASLQRNTGFATLMINYTYSKLYADGAITHGYPDNGNSEFYGVSPSDRPQVLSAAYIINLPKLNEANTIVKEVAGGWEFSGITQIEDGANLTSNTGYNFGVTYNSVYGASPVPNGPNGQVSVAQNDTTLLGSPDIQLQPELICDPRKGNAKGVYLNVNCFAIPPGNGINGTMKMPYFPSPKYWKSDLTLMKNFKIKQKQSIQFRAAAFNFLNHGLTSFKSNDVDLSLNHTNVSVPTGFYGDANTPAFLQAGNSFGKATQHYGQRIVEFSTKYSF
jgi:hypothetical protein